MKKRLLAVVVGSALVLGVAAVATAVASNGATHFSNVTEGPFPGTDSCTGAPITFFLTFDGV
jgi:hypothetical protein